MTSQFLFSLMSSIFIGGAAGYLGSLMITKRMALVAGPLGHLALPGVALALIYGFDISLGAFPFVMLGIILVWLFEIKTKLPTEALTAIVFAGGVAASFLFLPIEEAETALVGDISVIGFWEMLISLIVSSFLFFVVFKIYPKMILINVSRDLAKVENINVKKYNLIYLFCVGTIVALGVKIVGSLMTVALVAVPAVSARNLCLRMGTYRLVSSVVGVLSVVSGLIFFKWSGLPAGPLIIISSVVIFLISLIFKRA